MIAPVILLMHLAALGAASAIVAIAVFLSFDIAMLARRTARGWDAIAGAVVRFGVAALQPLGPRAAAPDRPFGTGTPGGRS